MSALPGATLRKRSHSSAEPPRSVVSKASSESEPSQSDNARGLWTESVATITGNIKSTLVQRLEENHLKQAFYYSAANVILVFLSATGIALWFVFQEFIEPLFWALLCGALLHPIKTKWVNVTDEWLRSISRSNIPLFVGIIILILSVPGNLFRFLTKTPGRTITVGAILAFHVIVDMVGLQTLLNVFLHSTKVLFSNLLMVVEHLIMSGVTVAESTTVISGYVVMSVIVVYVGVVYAEVNHLANPLLCTVTKWIIWLFFAAKAYPYVMYNWLTVLIFAGFLLCSLLGLQKQLQKRHREFSSEKIPPRKVKKTGSFSTELITILFIFCAMYVANIIQVVVFLLATGAFYWLLLGVQYLVLKALSHRQFSEHVVPSPLRFVWDCFEKGDQLVVQWLRKQLNMLCSVLIIVLLISGAVLVAVFFSVQLYKENTQLAEDVWENRNVILPKFEFIKGFMNKTADIDLYDSARGVLMEHGRDWLQHRLTLITGSEVSILDLQQKVGEFWDDTSGALSNLEWHVPTNIVTDLVRSGDAASFWKAYGSNVSMVAETIWSQLVLNVRLVWWVVMKGWGFFNFLFSLILFLTSLFYLLGTSTDQTYKPLSWVLFFFPEEKMRKQAGELINESVSQVFKTALKLALFHGLWCWCTFSMFGCHMVYLPTILAAFMAMVPLLPTYCDCIPGVLELWLVWKRPFSAISLFVLHLMASWWVDPMVYSEIQSSHHYVTGLSVVGGLYFFGIQGVLIGPMLVCTVLVLRKITMVMGDQRTTLVSPKQ